MLKKASSVVLGRLSSSGRLTNSAARTNVALLIRRAVRPSEIIVQTRQFPLSFLTKSQGVPRSFGEVRSRPCHDDRALRHSARDHERRLLNPGTFLFFRLQDFRRSLRPRLLPDIVEAAGLEADSLKEHKPA